MKDNNQNSNAADSSDDDLPTHNVQGMGTLLLDTSSPHAMLSGLVSTLGETYGYQMFSNLTGIHVLDGALIPSCITEYDILH